MDGKTIKHSKPASRSAVASCSAIHFRLVSVFSAFVRITVGRSAISSAIGNNPNCKAIMVSDAGRPAHHKKSDRRKARDRD